MAVKRDELDQLLARLNISGVRTRDTALYEVIAALIRKLKELTLETDSSTGSTTIINQVGSIGPPGLQGEDGDDGIIGPMGFKGDTGDIGAGGPAGPVTVGPMGLNGEDGEDGFPIPGNQGIQGPQGIDGPQGPITLGPMGMNGEDGENGFPIPGPPGRDGSSSNDWDGRIVVCAGDGDPDLALSIMQTAGFVSPSPNAITTSQGRVSYFKLKTAITVANIRWYGVAVVTSIYHVAIYRASDNVRMSADNEITTALSAWGAVADSFTLAADTLYYCVVSADSAGTVAGLAALGTTIALNSGQIRVLPTGWPGNLDFDNNFVNSYAFAVVAVTSGALPNPGNAPTAFSANLTSGMPAIFLDAV